MPVAPLWGQATFCSCRPTLCNNHLFLCSCLSFICFIHRFSHVPPENHQLNFNSAQFSQKNLWKKVNGKWKWESLRSDSFRPHGLYSPWNSPGQNTGMCSFSLLQRIFPTQESNWGPAILMRLCVLSLIFWDVSTTKNPWPEAIYREDLLSAIWRTQILNNHNNLNKHCVTINYDGKSLQRCWELFI